MSSDNEIKRVVVITPVKNSIELTADTVRAVMGSEASVPYTYIIYDDFSSDENAARLDEIAAEVGCEVVHLRDHTTHPSPNYLMVLQMARERALSEGAAMMIVESDVVVKADTIERLVRGAERLADCGLAAAVTTDENGVANYPYEFARGAKEDVRAESKHLSFCCTLFSPRFLREFDFGSLDASKNWHDVTVSHRSLQMGFRNYLFPSLGVWHRPHGSRPWKHLKYSNPIKYYWRKIVRGLDKI